MKKVFVLAVLAVILFACKSKSPVNNNTKVSSQVDLKGEWVISSVSYPGSDYIKVNSFDIADSKCFEGSKWKFISNNNEGNMTLTSSNCAAFSSPITWFINQDQQFILKVIQADAKAKKVRSGYVLKVANQTETSFQLVDNITFGNKPIEVVYQFNKTSK